MKQVIIGLSVVALLAGLISVPAISAQISANPIGFAVAVEQNETASEQISLTNVSDQDVSYEINFTSPEEGRRAHGPRRDAPPEGRFAYFDDGDEDWGSFNGMWNRVNANLTRFRSRDFANFEINNFDCIWIREDQDDPFNELWNNSRARFEEWVDNGGVIYHCVGTNFFFVVPIMVGGLRRYGLESGSRNGRVLVTDDQNADNHNYLCELTGWHGGEQLDGDGWSQCGFHDEDLQNIANSDYYQVIAEGIDGGAYPGVVVYRYGQGWAIASGTTDSFEWNHYPQEGQWGWALQFMPYYLSYLALPHWVSVNHRRATIRGGEHADLDLTFTPKDMDAGSYELLLGVVLGDDPNPSLQMSCIMTVGDPTSALAGTITDAATGQPVEGATASLDRYILTRTSDADGRYAIESLPATTYNVTFSAPDYLPETHNVDLSQDDVELNVGLLHSECNLSTNEVNEELNPDTDTHVHFSASDDGNGPLTYRVERRLIGDANAAPWENRRNFNVGATLSDSRIEGVAFDGEHFYFAGANAANPNTIYVTDRDGNETNHYTQLGASQYGMKDLEWDGELLWGAGYLQNVYGFTPDGDSVISFQTAYNPTGNIAYDSDEDLLWVSGTTTNISAYDRQGNATDRTLNRKGLKIYGLAYWPQDPDGYNLYIFDQPVAGLQLVHKMNTNTGDTLLAHSIPVNQGESPCGIFICNTYDVYSWVMMAMHNVAPNEGNDRLSIYQLAGRKDWMVVDPTEGMIEMGERQDFDLYLNAAGLPAVEFQGELVFLHDGIGGETHLPITMNVVEGQQQEERNLHLVRGWNLVSANVQPGDDDVCAITQGLADGGQLVMMKDDVGHFYAPAYHFNNIPCWKVEQGYLMQVTQDLDLSLTGLAVAADDPIALREGWQMVSYYPRNAVVATSALAGIADQLVMAKDGLGRFYVPSEHFSNMGQMMEGQGYMMQTANDVELVYQAGDRRASVETGEFASVYDRPCRYPIHPATDRNMSLLLKASGTEGDVAVRVKSDGLLVGSGVIDRGLAGIALWGDDPTTEVIDGAKEGDLLELCLRDATGERRLSVAVLKAGDKSGTPRSNVAPPLTGDGELTYQTDGLVIATAEASRLPSNFLLTAAYPNPFNSVTRIGFGLPEATQVSVKIFDVSGREVATLVSGQLNAGNHAAIWNAEAASAGVYLVKMDTPKFSETRKVTLLK